MSGQRLIRLEQWLAQVFGDDPPSKRTVWRWIDAGRIYPAPQKYGGKCYYFDPTARLMPMQTKRIATLLLSFIDLRKFSTTLKWCKIVTFAHNKIKYLRYSFDMDILSYPQRKPGHS